MICPYLKKTTIKKYFDYEKREITEITQEFEDCVGVACPFAKLVKLPDCLKVISDMKGKENKICL